MKTRGLAEDGLNLLRRHAVIDDKVETDLGQREAKLLSGAVDRASGACQIRSQIDDWNNLRVCHPTLLPLGHDTVPKALPSTAATAATWQSKVDVRSTRGRSADI